jgi:iron complex outermembrane receptor protein
MKKSALVIAVGSVLGANVAVANLLEEVVVTAQKREQSLQDVGIAVSAFSGNQMDQLGWDTADDVLSQVPGVTLIQPNGPSSFYVNVRGVAQNDFSGDNQEGPVAVYVDDVYVASPTGASFQLFDFERVEILRGPQGTLFGRNATGGLVHYVTRRPSEETEGYIRATVGDYSQRDIEGALGGKIADGVLGRISFSSATHDGLIENRIGPDLNDNDTYALRAQLLFQIGESSELLLNARMGDLDNKNGPFEHQVSRPNAQGLGVNINDPTVLDQSGGDIDTATGEGTGIIFTPWQNFGYRDPDNGKPFAGDYDTIGFIKVETEGYTATFTSELSNGMEFVSITDYNTLKRDYMEDSDAGPQPYFSFSVKSDMEQFSQEFRLSGEMDRMRWVTGAYYLKYEGDLFTGGPAGGFAQTAFGPVLLGLVGGDAEAAIGLTQELFPTNFGFDSPFSTTTESTAVFGQIEYDLADNLRLTAGLRWSREEKETSFNQYFSLFENPNSSTVSLRDSLGIGTYWSFDDGRYSNIGAWTFEGGAIPLLEGDAETSIDDDFITAKFGLDWTPGDDLLLYASYNRGVKAGGFNAPLDASLFAYGALPAENMTFDKETLHAYEAGFKATLWDGKARLNGAVYYYDYQDYQAFSLEGLTLFVFNTDAENYGFELEFQASPTANMDVLLGVGYVNSTVDDAYTTPSGDPLDRTAIMTPEWTFNGMFRYEWPLAIGNVAAQYDFNYLGDHFFQLKNSPTGEQDAYVVSNVRLSYTTPDDKWIATAFVNNVTDEEYKRMVFDLSGSPDAGGFGMSEYFYANPRWWGLSLQYQWGN